MNRLQPSYRILRLAVFAEAKLNKKVDSSDIRSGFKNPFLYLGTIIVAMILTTPFLQDYVKLRICWRLTKKLFWLHLSA
jgi:hypothetical protein